MMSIRTLAEARLVCVLFNWCVMSKNAHATVMILAKVLDCLAGGSVDAARRFAQPLHVSKLSSLWSDKLDVRREDTKSSDRSKRVTPRYEVQARIFQGDNYFCRHCNTPTLCP